MRIGLTLFASACIVHILLGAYAVYDGGFFGMGFNSPERYVYHGLAGSEARFTASGAAKYIVDDLCIQRCPQCSTDCYNPSDLSLDCVGGCSLLSPKGLVLAGEGDVFETVLNRGALYSKATFRCYDKACGFDTKIGKNLTYSTGLPEGIRQV
ncbi:MAG: hypothetical protein V1875_05815 [Candidatus Altiarchaeota archaeon]